MEKTMTADSEIIAKLYKNVKMGADSITKLLPKVTDGEFKTKLTDQMTVLKTDIAALEEKIEDNQRSQAAAGSDFVKLQQLQTELEELEAALEAKPERWMYLTELKEKIDAQK